MPGSIRVSVLESLDLPAEATGGKYVSIKVNVGKREYQTKHSKADGDRTTAWNSDFTFPVLNLRDNLVVALLDSKGNTISQTDIGMPIIIEKGFWDDMFPLKGGGHVHLRLNFVLTAEERKRIEAMREAALKRKEHGILKKNVTIQVLCPATENGSSASVSSTDIAQANQEDGKSKDSSHDKENRIATLAVPQVSQLNEVQKKTEIIEEASGESSAACTSSPIEYVTIKKESSNDVKGISGNHLQRHGCQDLPQYNLEGTSISVASKELIPSSASISTTGIAQATPEDGKNKDGSHKKGNEIAILLVPEVSQSNEVQGETEIIEEVTESSTASIYPPIEHVTNEKASSQDVKGTCGNNLQGQGCQDLPQQNLEGLTPALSEELTRSKESSFPSTHISSPENQSKGIMWENTLIPNENLQAVLSPHVKDDLAECENSQTDNLIDTDPMIEPAQREIEDTRSLLPDTVIVSKISPSQALAAIHQTGEIDIPGSPLQQENRTLTPTQTFLGSRPPESLHIQSPANLISEFTMEGGTSDALVFESTSLLVNDETANNYLVKFSNKHDIAILGLSTSPSMLLQSSADGSIPPTPFVDIPNADIAGENIGLPPVSPKGSQPQEMCPTHESSKATEHLPSSIVDGGDPSVPVKNNILANYSGPAFGAESVQCSEDLSVVQPLSNVVNAEKTELLVQDIYPVENNRTDSPNRVLPLDAENGSLAGWPVALQEGSSLKIVPSQSKSVSVVNAMVDTASSVSTCFASLPTSQTMKGDSTQSSVKAKIKAFESNISQDSDHHSSPQVKSDHKTEAERARQRLRAEAAAAEAAEARRRAEEEELKSKSNAKGRERKSSSQEKLEESRLKSSAKVKRKCLEKNEDEDERKIQEIIKDITVAGEDIRRHEADRRKDGQKQKVDEKRLELGERNRWQEDMTALRRPVQKQGEKPLRLIETTEKTMKNDPDENALTWERIRLGELQLKRHSRNSRDKSVKPGLSGNKNDGGEKSRVDASTMESSSRKESEQKQNLEALTGKSQLPKDENRSAAEITLITAEKRKTGGDQKIQIGNDIIDDNQKAKLRQGSKNDLIIEQRVQLMAQENSFAEDIPTEEGSASLEEELEDFVNKSKSFGGLIKQAMCAAALLAAGALFMWAREEKMSRRRDRITQSKDMHDFLQKNDASSRSLREQSGEPNSRNSNPSSKVMDNEEITRIGESLEDIFLRNTNGSCILDNLVNRSQVKTQGRDSNKGSCLTTIDISKIPMTYDLNIDSKVQGLTIQEVEDMVNLSEIFSIYDGDVTSGEDLQISLFSHAKMRILSSPIYKEIYGMEPTNQKVPMYFAMQLYAHLVIGHKVDFRSIPKEVHIKKCDEGMHDQISHNVNIDYEHMLNPKIVVTPHDIEQRVQYLNEEKNQIESIFQRECQHLQTFVHAFSIISERARQDINMAKNALNGPINTKRELERSLKGIELQTKQACLDNLDMLEAHRSRCVAQIGDATQKLRATSTWILELQACIKDHREHALQALMLVKEMQQRGRLLQQEHDMLSRGTQANSYKVLSSRFLLFPYLRGTLKSQNLESIQYVDIHKPCCCVCLSTLQQDGFYGLQCGHLYHFSCLLIHMIGQNKCATCRDEISHETYLNLGMEDFIPSIQLLDEAGLPLDCTPKKYL